MKVEETRRVYITLTKEEKEKFRDVSALIERMYHNMNNEDELAFVDEDDIIDSFDRNQVKDIVVLLFNMAGFCLEII